MVPVGPERPGNRAMLEELEAEMYDDEPDVPTFAQGFESFCEHIRAKLLRLAGALWEVMSCTGRDAWAQGCNAVGADFRVAEKCCRGHSIIGTRSVTKN